MKQIICHQLFLSSHDWLLMAYRRRCSSPASPKMDIRSPKYRRSQKKFEIFQAPSYKKQKKIIAPSKKMLVGDWEYIPWKMRIQIQTSRKLLG